MSEIVNAIVNAAPEQLTSLQTGIPETGTDLPEKLDNASLNKEVAPPKEDERLSSRFAAISKKERMLLEREQKLKSEREEYEDYKKAKESAKLDPLAYLEKSGLKLEDVIYSGLGSKPEKNVEDRIKELQDRLERKEQDEIAEKQRYESERIQSSISGFKAEIDKHIKDNPEKYELINLKGAHEEVYSLIEAWLEKTSKLAKEDPTGETKPVLMSIDEAAKKIEEYYENHEYEIFSKSKKLASKYRPIDTPKSNPVSPTLTNRNAVNPTSNQSQETTYMSFEQKREASIKRSAQLLQELQQQRR